MRRADSFTTFTCELSWNLAASTSWNPLGLSRPVMGLLYLYLFTQYQALLHMKPLSLLKVTQFQPHLNNCLYKLVQVSSWYWGVSAMTCLDAMYWHCWLLKFIQMCVSGYILHFLSARHSSYSVPSWQEHKWFSKLWFTCHSTTWHRCYTMEH